MEVSVKENGEVIVTKTLLVEESNEKISNQYEFSGFQYAKFKELVENFTYTLVTRYEMDCDRSLSARYDKSSNSVHLKLSESDMAIYNLNVIELCQKILSGEPLLGYLKNTALFFGYLFEEFMATPNSLKEFKLENSMYTALVIHWNLTKFFQLREYGDIRG